MPAAGAHPVDVARGDALHRAEAVAVQDGALEQVGHGGEPDVRVRPHIDARAGREVHGPHVVEKNERPHHLVRMRGQQPSHAEAAEVADMRLEDGEHVGAGEVGVCSRVPLRFRWTGPHAACAAPR